VQGLSVGGEVPGSDDEDEKCHVVCSPLHPPCVWVGEVSGLVVEVEDRHHHH